jgi:type IX secretion system PorP/SprF family membrane protein
MKTFSLKISTVILFTAACAAANAQQIYKISQYMERSFIHNPAAAGANNCTTIGATYRTQWSGISGAPKTVLAYGDTYFSSMHAGAGIVVYSDKTGPTSRTGGELNISYSIKLDGDEKRLMFGIGGEIIQYKVDKGKIASSIPDDPLLASGGTATKGDASAGVYYRSPTFNIGASVKQLIQSKLNFIANGTNIDGRLYRQYFLVTSYNLRTDESNVLIPHFELRYQPNAPVDFEGGVLLQHKDFIHFGVSAHYKQSYTLFLGLKLAHKLLIGYAYDNYKTPVSDFDDGHGAHEITLRYFFTKKK